jgi:hypothetical protein
MSSATSARNLNKEFNQRLENIKLLVYEMTSALVGTQVTKPKTKRAAPQQMGTSAKSAFKKITPNTKKVPSVRRSPASGFKKYKK